MKFNKGTVFVVLVLAATSILSPGVDVDAFARVSPTTRFCLITGSNHRKSCYRVVPLHHSFGSIERLSRRVIPPIAKQKQSTSDLSIQDHFRPRFIAKEFIVGTKYMLHMYCWLILGSLIARNIAFYTPTLSPLPLNQLTDLVYESNLAHSIEQFIKQKCSFDGSEQGLKEIIGSVVVSPIIEEISYRGIWQSIAFLTNWVVIFFFTLVCFEMSPILGWLWLRLIWLGIFAAIFRAVKYKAALMNVLPMIARDVIAQTLLCPPLLQIQKAAMDKKSFSTDIEKAKRFRISRFFLKNCDSETSSRLQSTIGRYLNLLARWNGSMMFAAAHIGIPDMHNLVKNGRMLAIPSMWQYAFAQKYIGTFVSSFLVESRLVVHRGTLWGAVGAHVAFNALGALRFTQYLVCGKLFDGTISFSLFTISITVVLYLITHRILKEVVFVLEKIEKWLDEKGQ